MNTLNYVDNPSKVILTWLLAPEIYCGPSTTTVDLNQFTNCDLMACLCNNYFQEESK